MTSCDVMHSFVITISYCRVITQRAEDEGQGATPFLGGAGGGALRVTLISVIAKIGWDHLKGQPPRGGPTSYQN